MAQTTEFKNIFGTFGLGTPCDFKPQYITQGIWIMTGFVKVVTNKILDWFIIYFSQSNNNDGQIVELFEGFIFD